MKYNRFIVISLGMLLFFGMVPTESAINFENSKVTISFADDNYTSSSLMTSTKNLPDLQGYLFQIRVSDDISNTFSGNTTLNMDQNLIALSDTIELVLTNGSNTISLKNNTIPSGVLFHLRHVYSNWTAGQPPPPDQRGLGVGAMIDTELLVETLPETLDDPAEAALIGEQILNLLLDDQTDFNKDGDIEKISDGFGMFEYIYGMRDHINNAGNSADATEDISSLADQINSNLTNSIMDTNDYGTFLANLNQSTTDLAVIYQKALSLLDADLAEATDILSSLTTLMQDQILPVLRNNFNLFRDNVYAFSLALDVPISIDKSNSASNQDSPLLFAVLPLALLISSYSRRFRD